MVLSYHLFSKVRNINFDLFRFVFVVIWIIDKFLSLFFQLFDINVFISAENLVVHVDKHNQEVSLFDVHSIILLLIFRYWRWKPTRQTLISIHRSCDEEEN